MTMHNYYSFDRSCKRWVISDYGNNKQKKVPTSRSRKEHDSVIFVGTVRPIAYNLQEEELIRYKTRHANPGGRSFLRGASFAFDSVTDHNMISPFPHKGTGWAHLVVKAQGRTLLSGNNLSVHTEQWCIEGLNSFRFLEIFFK